MDTGTHERVANWSPDIVDAVDPCDPGTDPRNGPFAGIPSAIPFNLDPDGNVPEAVVVRRNLPYSLPRSVGCRDLRLVGVYVFVLFAYFLFDFRSSLCCHLCLVLFACLLLYDWHRRRVVCYISAFRCSKMTHFEDVLEWFAQLKIAGVVMSTLRATCFDLVFCQRNQRQ